MVTMYEAEMPGAFPGTPSQAIEDRRSCQILLSLMNNGLSMASVALHCHNEAAARRSAVRAATNDSAVRKFAHVEPFLHAKSFVYELEEIRRELVTLCRLPGVPAELTQVMAAFDRVLPQLVGIRDTSHHPESRALGQDRRGRPIDFKPIDALGIDAPQGATVIGAMSGSTFGTLVESGHLAQIDVSDRVLRSVHRLVQAAVDCFDWNQPAFPTDPLPSSWPPWIVAEDEARRERLRLFLEAEAQAGPV